MPCHRACCSWCIEGMWCTFIFRVKWWTVWPWQWRYYSHLQCQEQCSITHQKTCSHLHFYKILQTHKIHTVWTSGLRVCSVADGTHCLHLQGLRRWKPVWSSRTLLSTYQTTICQSDMSICQMVLNVHKERDMHRHDNTYPSIPYGMWQTKNFKC